MLNRGNSILNRLFVNSIYSIRQLAESDSETKAMYCFLRNDNVNVSEQDIVRNMASNCTSCIEDKTVLYIQDTSEINLYNHRNRIKKYEFIGYTNCK
ncbi:hypothetical protein [Flavobacterium gawalongense]|uniref:Transposase n=1 Tax=Flavobacterium gawalongense TaxID=2594432 RepID=A0A553BAP4_9FLAO|nr:hypothetical protein [Flavobacterium gawalongense]TRX05311.1 hypothetical protein FNW11_16350 [Flavobacterium gawalongense]TRX08562.1 hypothetical protein FNW10_12850 [Flavobacterium gawalongense]TRX24890.1 hypothetical protein FNW38_12660 [Flavobacterium gawalongense]